MEDWHEQVFGEIITNYDGKQYELLMPARHGKTTLIRRLAKYFASIGKDVRVLSEGHVIKDYPFSHEKPLTKDTVLLIEGIIKWDPSYPMQKVGGTLITAWTPPGNRDDYPFRSFKIVKRMDNLP